MNHTSAYQHAFVYIRQLAIHLRTAIINKTKDSFKTVYNWQYINCLRVWSKLLSLYAIGPESTLRPLIYPFIQVCMGVIDLLPVPRFYPLKFVVIRTIQKISRNCSLFIPLSHHLLSMLHLQQMHSKKKEKKSKKGIDLNHVLKVSKAVVTTNAYQEVVWSECMKLLVNEYGIYSYSASFPELIIPAKIILKRSAKKSKNPEIRKQIQQLIDKLEVNSQFIIKKRNALSYAPKDINTSGMSGINTFKVNSNNDDGGVDEKKGGGKNNNPINSDISPLERFCESLKEEEKAEKSSASWDISKQKKLFECQR